MRELLKCLGIDLETEYASEAEMRSKGLLLRKQLSPKEVK